MGAVGKVEPRVAGVAARVPGDVAGREILHRLNPLITQLEQSLQQFAQHAGDMAAAATEYRAALGNTAASLEAARPLVEIPALTHLTQAILERTRILAQDMHRRQQEAAGWRETLRLARADTAMIHLSGQDDPLSFEAVLETQARLAHDASVSLSIACCDIDRFATIKDAHGRDTGDRLIQALARGLQRISAQSCHVVRHGEQFMLLFCGVSVDQAGRQLDEARQEFTRRKLINRETEIPIGTVTFSGGVADALAYADPRAAVKAAAEALGQAKEQGSNRIVVFAGQQR